MSGRGDPVIENIVSLHKQGNAKKIIDVFRECAFCKDKADRGKLHLVTWPLPTENNLQDFANFVISEQVSRIYSIGCGTGLLEWIMLQFINNCHEFGQKGKSENMKKVQLVGVEVDIKWWNSSYSPPIFIPLQFYGETFHISEKKGFGESGDLVIFCYFNNLQIFAEYLSKFRGNWIVIIGPISTEQFCAPGPRELAENEELPINEWDLLSCEQFGFIAIDHLAIYKRVKSNHSQLK